MAKIKEFIVDIMKDIIKYMFVLIVFFAILIAAIYMFLKLNDLHPKGWNQFEQRMQKEYGFIKNIEISSNERCISVNYISSKSMDSIEAEKIFKETRSFLLSEKVFSSIEEYQKRKYPNDFYGINIRFYYKNGGRKLLYEFTSGGKSSEGCEDFKIWYMHVPGQNNAISINP